MTVWRVISVLSLAFAWLLPAEAFAVDLNQWVRGLKANVYVTERLEYETNVFQTESHTEDDLISRTIPGFVLTYERGPVVFGAGYRAEFLKFFSLDEQDNVHHIGSVSLNLNFARLKIAHRQEFTLTSDPPTTELTGRTDSTTINIPFEVEYALTPRFGIGASYSFTHVQFQKSAEQMNHDTHLYGGYVAWKLVPKADVRFGYHYGYSEFDNVIGTLDRDAKHHIIFVGLRGDLTPKITSTFRAGYEVRNQESDRLKDSSAIFLGGESSYQPTERTKITLATNKTFENSIFGQQGESVVYETTSAALSFEQLLGTKVRFNARLTGVLNDYPRKETTGIRTLTATPKFREDTIFGWGGGLDYDIQKWLSVGAEYSHTRRDSTFDEFNYKDDKFTAKLTLQF